MGESMDEFDLLVVGAGTAGCVSASTAAKKGLKTCIIDCKNKVEIGEKVCGDAIGSHHFKRLGIPPPSGEELDSMIEGVRVYSPDLSSVFTMDGEGVTGFIVNRHSFGQRLLKEAIDLGVELYDCTLATEPIIEAGFVKGAVAKGKDGQRRILRAKITIDASGVAAVIRRKLPEEFNVEKEVAKRDLMACYREVRGNVEVEEGYCQIYLNQSIARGGYFWIFPRSGRSVNVGVGVQASRTNTHPKTQLYSQVLSKPLFKDTKILTAGGGYVPTRRPLDSLVGDGVMIVGDAACLVNPIHGGGIGPSMISGRIAAEVASEAIEIGILDRSGLWGYNREYMKAYGAKQAGLDVFRIFLQEISDEELNYGMRQRLVKERDVLRASLDGDLRLSITEKAERVFRSIRRPDFLIKLRGTARKMRRVKRHFLEYPEPEEFQSWRARIETFY
ncbi:MAG: NAD(P)/FAD-dependent oxidoreductase [Candidatus Bathyarchaeia archaeon]